MNRFPPRARIYGISRFDAAFSLVEVVLALGIFIFAGFAMVGLLGVGLQGSSDSKQQLQAATIAEFLCSTRRAAPTQDFTVSTSVQPNFPLPVLSTTTNNYSTPTYLTWDGAATTLAAGNARFGLIFSIMAPASYTASTNPGYSTVYLYLYWPPRASPKAATTGRYELTSTFALP